MISQTSRMLNILNILSWIIGRYIFKMAYVALLIGVLSWLGITFTGWIMEQGIKLPEMHNYLGGGGVFLLMGIILYIIAHIFKKGIELQTDNALTV